MEHLIIWPFTIGMLYILATLVFLGIKWIGGLSKIDKLRLVQSLRTKRTLLSVFEIVREGLLHRNIFKKHPLLGYMHMSLAFGWFLLIVFGHFEVWTAKQTLAVPLYLPIFFRYFEPGLHFTGAKIFAFLMDFFLLVVLSGVMLAWLKRFKKGLFGMKKTTRLRPFDQLALTTLWLIFPLRLLAESIAAVVYQNGSFLTNSVGSLLGNINNIENLLTPSWIAYSAALGLFFVALPNSRYMHIPTEILFIFLRNTGIKLKKLNNTYTSVQVYSCSRCGICLDNCQLTTAGIRDTQSVYLLKNIRNKNIDDEKLFNCLLCGKCQIDCPVGIDIIDLRITQRIESTKQYNSAYQYLQTTKATQANVVYFAGCMTHLTPGIIKSMKQIFALAGENYWFLDEEKAPCCGRPLIQAGQYDAASKLIENNTEKIIASGAKKLIVSCPICYKVFREDYNLPNIDVVFHAQYILSLIESGKLDMVKSNLNYLYHDPCELGRGSNIYEEPRQVIAAAGNLLKIKNEREKAYCCGGSLGNLKMRQFERDLIRVQALNDYSTYNPDILVTACPKCKKTFARNKQLKVMDISEIVTASLTSNNNTNRIKKITSTGFDSKNLVTPVLVG